MLLVREGEREKEGVARGRLKVMRVSPGHPLLEIRLTQLFSITLQYSSSTRCKDSNFK